VSLKDELLKLLQTIGNAVEEIFQLIEEDPTFGDDGVAEILVSIENGVTLAFAKVERHA
jgi:hypothetical protein